MKVLAPTPCRVGAHSTPWPQCCLTQGAAGLLHVSTPPRARRAGISASASPAEAPACAAGRGIAAGPGKDTLAERRGGRGEGGSFDSSGTTKALVEQIWGVLQFWNAAPPSELGSTAVDVASDGDLVRRAQEANDVVQESKKEKEKEPPADIRRYLKATGLGEIQDVRLLASLCAHTYYLRDLTERKLLKMHGLRMVTTSHACTTSAVEVPRTAAQVMEDGDAMALTPLQAECACKDAIAPAAKATPAMETVAKLKKAEGKKEGGQSPAELVAARLGAAAMAAAAAAAPLTSNLSSLTSAAAGSLPIQAVTSQLQLAAAAGQSTALATVATVAAALGSARGADKAKKPAAKDGVGNKIEWYVCDEPGEHTRYFVIQGSVGMHHWLVNLTFDPVMFEEPALGVKVHRGVYETAQVLYERFRPIVEEHLASSPLAKVVFTGHSLGGSLATLLMLMYLHRRIVRPLQLAPTYTFGAPAIFCEGGVLSGCVAQDGAAGSCPMDLAAAGSSPRSLLERLGLPAGAVRNVVMHRDIVPRAFACDYSLVADFLGRVGEGFRDHPCLQNPNGRQVMYSFIGKIMVLQPDPEQSFVRGEGGHVMLPGGPGLYTLREPTLLSDMASSARAEVARSASALGSRLDRASPLGNISPAANLSTHSLRKSTTLTAPPPALGPPATSLAEAVMELMDCPHPLETLADASAYGFDGSISRYHNPDNYTRALGGVLRARTRPWRALLADRAALRPGQVNGPARDGTRGAADQPTLPWYRLLRDAGGTRKVRVRPSRSLPHTTGPPKRLGRPENAT